MTTKLYPRDLPAAYIRQASEVTDPDRFINAADLQRFADNYNICMAKRTRQCLMHRQWTDESTLPASSTGYLTFETVGGVSREAGTALWSGPVFLPHYCKTFDVVIVACKADAESDDPIVYAAMDGPKEMMDLDDSYSATVSAAAGTFTKYTISNVPVPPEAAEEGHATLTLVAYTPLGATTSTGNTAHDADKAWFVEAYGGSTYPNAGVKWSDTEIEARRIAGSKLVTIDGAAYYKHFLDRPFNKTPDPQNDTFDVYGLAGLRMRSLSTYTNVATDPWSGSVEVP